MTLLHFHRYKIQALKSPQQVSYISSVLIEQVTAESFKKIKNKNTKKEVCLVQCILTRLYSTQTDEQ